MNPDTNKFEQLQQMKALEKAVAEQERQVADRKFYELSQLVRPNGEPVPQHWSVFRVGENYVINDYTFKCAYIGETSILFEPVAPVVVGEETTR